MIEINAAPKRLDLDWRWWPLAKQKGVKCVINPDATAPSGCRFMVWCRGRSQGWLTKMMLMIVCHWGKIEAALAARRGGKK